MRRIGELDHGGRARTFSDVLVSHGIANDVRADAGAFDIWVHDDAQVAQAKDLLIAFQAEPDGGDVKARAAKGRAQRAAQRRKDEAYAERIRLAQRAMHGADGRGWLTITLLGGALITAAVSQLGADLTYIQWMFVTLHPPAARLPEVASGEVWRLFTPMFVHFGLIHLLFNMSMWWSFAQVVEARKGLPFFLPFVLVASAGSTLSQVGWDLLVDPHRLSLMGGMSGVLYAVFGYVLVKGRIDPLDQLGVPQQTAVLLIGWLFLCMTGVFGNIANAAHVGGLVIGVLWALGDVAWFQLRKRRGGP